MVYTVVMNKYAKGVVFDFNGTLLFDNEPQMQAWDAVSMEVCGRHMSQAEMETHFAGLPNASILRELHPGMDEAYYESFSQRKEELYRSYVLKMNHGSPHLVKGAGQLFDILKDHQIPFTIASASIKANIDFFVRTFHLDHWIKPESIVYDDGTYAGKKEMFLEAGRRLKRENLLIFEDSLNGIKAASEIHAQIVVIDSPVLQQYYSQYPCILKRIHDYTEIEDEIMNLLI